jgi:hypothetical protein
MRQMSARLDALESSHAALLPLARVVATLDDAIAAAAGAGSEAERDGARKRFFDVVAKGLSSGAGVRDGGGGGGNGGGGGGGSGGGSGVDGGSGVVGGGGGSVVVGGGGRGEDRSDCETLTDNECLTPLKPVAGKTWMGAGVRRPPKG